MSEISKKQSLLEELFGDLETFDHILSRVLHNWGGQGAVIPIEAHDQPYWLFDNPETFTPFCRLIRAKSGTANICWECDLTAAKHAAKIQKPVKYVCDNGLLDVAVPILIDQQSIGTIVFGQRRLSDDDNFNQTAFQYLREAEEKLGLEEFALQREWETVPTVTSQNVDDAITDVVSIAKFVSNIVSERRTLQLKNNRSQMLERELDKLSLANLSKTKPVLDFWNTINTLFPNLCHILDVEEGIVLRGEIDNPEFTIQCSYPNNLDQVAKTKINSSLIEKMSRSGILITNLRDFQLIWEDDLFFRKVDPQRCSGTNVACLLIEVEPDIRLIIVMRASCQSELEHKLDWLSLEKQENLVELVADRIRYEYSAVILLYERIIHERDRLQYIQDVTHQLVGPLSGIRAHCENLLRGRLTVAKGKTVLETLVEQAGLLQRYAINFGYAARQNGEDIFKTGDWQFDLATNKRIVEIMIKSVKSFQGQAKASGLLGPSVDEVSFRNFPALKIVPELFEILVLNLCDNAIKYSYESSPITIIGSKSQNSLEIEFTNHGIPITEEEVTVIFKRHTRSKSAMEFSPGGSGIGLFLCDQICRLHGWTIRAMPSKRSVYGYETNFVLKIPIEKEGKNG